MPHIKAKYFPFLLLTSAIIVEVCAVFFSMYGLTKLFAGAAISVGIMATSLELAKVVSVSYLYRHWQDLGKLYRSYLATAVFILMLITSLGIYGFLSNAFQGATLGLEKDIAKLTLQEDEINRITDDNKILKSEKVDFQTNLNVELSGLVIKEETRYADVNKRNSVSRRYQSLIKDKDKQISENNKKIEQLNQNISDSKIKMIDSGTDVGPIIFVSKAFGIEISTVVQYLILLFIIVFDPLALALIIGFNKVTIENYEIDHETPNKEIEVLHPETIQSPSKPNPIIVDDIGMTSNNIPKHETLVVNTAKTYSTDEEDSIVYVDTAKEAAGISVEEQSHGPRPRNM